MRGWKYSPESCPETSQIWFWGFRWKDICEHEPFRVLSRQLSRVSFEGKSMSYRRDRLLKKCAAAPVFANAPGECKAGRIRDNGLWYNT